MMDLLKGAAAFLAVMFILALLRVVGESLQEFFTRRRRFISLFVTQDVVTAQLKEFARGLKALFHQQERVYTQGLGGYEERDREDARIKECIVQTKKEFWSNVGLAKHFGFAVPGTIEDALDGATSLGTETRR